MLSANGFRSYGGWLFHFSPDGEAAAAWPNAPSGELFTIVPVRAHSKVDRIADRLPMMTNVSKRTRFGAAGTERHHQEEALNNEIPRNPLKNSNRFWPGSPFGDRELPTGLRAGLAGSLLISSRVVSRSRYIGQSARRYAPATFTKAAAGRSSARRPPSARETPAIRGRTRAASCDCIVPRAACRPWPLPPPVAGL